MKLHVLSYVFITIDREIVHQKCQTVGKWSSWKETRLFSLTCGMLCRLNTLSVRETDNWDKATRGSTTSDTRLSWG